MENQSSQIWTIIAIIVVAGGAYWIGNSQTKNNPTVDVKTDTSMKATTVQVGTFYDGEEGYSLSIPSGNESTCIWTGTGGNAAIPWSETTHANTATEKHTIRRDLSINYDFKVNCTDDFGNQYVGVFPKSE